MTFRVSGLGGCGLSLAALMLTAAAGCGDGPICPSDVVVVLESPAAGGTVTSADDQSSGDPGIQVNVQARSNLKAGAAVSLVVTSSSGAVATYDDTTDGEGDVNFTGVTLPAGSVNLEVSTSSDCGTASDSGDVTVVTNGICDLTIAEGPIDNDFYDPFPVLNSTNDSDSDLADFQATVGIQTGADFAVELFVYNAETGTETSAGEVTADDSGAVSYSVTLAQGRQAIRATCVKGDVAEASATNTVMVDTVVPTCELRVPERDVTVTPDDDVSGDVGIQMVWTGTVDADGSDDVEGEPTSFYRGTVPFDGTPVDEDGNASTETTGEFKSPGTFEVRFEAQDHAENLCSDGYDVDVIMDGCPILHVEPDPLQTVSSDSDSNSGNGLQADFVVSVPDADCEGLTVFTQCCDGGTCFAEESATVPSGGLTTVSDVTLNTEANAQGLVTCTSRIVNNDSFETSDAAVVQYDTLAPVPNLVFVNPDDISCGDAVVEDVANDADGNLANGFQIDVVVTAPAADFREIDLTTSSGPCTGTCTCPHRR